MTDSFITQPEEALTRFDDEDQGGVIWAFDLAVALRSLLGEYKRLTTEGEVEYGVEYHLFGDEREVRLMGEAAARFTAQENSCYRLMQRTKAVPAGPWVPVEGEEK